MSIKSLLRICSAVGCRTTGLLGRAERRNCHRLSILCYHRILPAELKRDYYNPDLVVTPTSFREHCLALKERFEVLPLSDAVAQWRNNPFSERPLAAITFDDGYWDNCRLAAPILNRLNLRATFFVIADLAGSEIPPWYDQVGRVVQELQHSSAACCPGGRAWLARHFHAGSDVSAVRMIAYLKNLPPKQRHQLMAQLLEICPGISLERDRIMNWMELRRLADVGHEIGSHGLTHELLPLLDNDQLRAEVFGSRQRLQENLRRPVRSFCYPNGDVNSSVAMMVQAAGYTNAVTTAVGANEPHQDVYRLNRWFMHEERLCGPTGTPSRTLMRMEWSNLANRVFMRST